MTEAEQIARSTRPVTVASLRADLLSLGVAPGDTLLVHASLSSLGWVSGGAVAVIDALLQAVEPQGTIVMPAQSAGLTEPASWGAPPVPASWHQTIRETMPAYDPGTTPTRDMGRVAELFRNWPGALRSDHPSASFAALGPLSGQIIGHHDLADPLGEGSPLGALYSHDAKVLPIGASALQSGIATVGTLGEGRGILVGMRLLVDPPSNYGALAGEAGRHCRARRGIGLSGRAACGSGPLWLCRRALPGWPLGRGEEDLHSRSKVIGHLNKTKTDSKSGKVLRTCSGRGGRCALRRDDAVIPNGRRGYLPALLPMRLPALA